MPRALSALEASLFLDRHTETGPTGLTLLEEKHLIDNGGMFSEHTGDLAYPWGDGRAIYDAGYNGYVLVWRDASKRWHYIDLSDKPALAGQFNNEPYVSPDASFTNNIFDELKRAADRLQNAIFTGLLIGAAVLLVTNWPAPAPRYRTNPPKRRRRRAARRRRNPPKQIRRRGAAMMKNPLTEIYPPTRGVIIAGMKKGPGHPCDAACRRAGHKYKHRFKAAVEFLGFPNGDFLGRSKKP